MNNVNVTDFINTEYLGYANYVLSARAIPSCIDGFKKSQRKVLYTALNHAKNKRVKTAALSGMTVAYANYHHGSSSLDGAISLMTPLWKNNVPLFDGEGNFGSRLVNDPAAARYTFVKLHKNFVDNFPDIDLAEFYKLDDPEDPEPACYMPLIPWVLAQGIKGIAVGYATEIQQYSKKDLTKLCKMYLSGQNIDNEVLLPHFDSFNGRIYSNAAGVFNEGVINIKSATNVDITELPIGYQRETYISILDKLEDDNKIVSYNDKCSGGNFKFEVKLRRGVKYNNTQLIKLFKLTQKLNENLTTIDESGKLKIFKNKIEIIKYFCDWRLAQYKVRYSHYIKRDSDKLKLLQLRIMYINEVNSGVIQFINKSKSEVELFVSSRYKITKDLSDKLISMPMYNLTSSYKSGLSDTSDQLIADIKLWKSINHKEQYLKELK